MTEFIVRKDKDVQPGIWETKFRDRFLPEGQMYRLDVRVDPNNPNEREQIFKLMFETCEKMESGDCDIEYEGENNAH